MPHLAEWLRQFALPSLAAILATYVVLHLTQRRALREEQIEARVPTPHLSHGGKLAAIGVAAIGAVLVTASALDIQLGLPTLLCGLITTAAVLALSRQSPWPVLKGVSWSVIFHWWRGYS
jgi:arsenical pump membrane protein